MHKIQKMKKWFCENSIGHNTTFIHTQKHKNIMPAYTATECCRIMIEGLIPLQRDCKPAKIYIRGTTKHYTSRNFSFIQHAKIRKGKYNFVDSFDTCLTFFDCFDEVSMFVYLIVDKEVEIFTVKFFPCRLLRGEKVFLRQVEIFKKENFMTVGEFDCFEVKFKCCSLRELHLNWADPIKQEFELSNRLCCEKRVYNLNSPMCIFCFRVFVDVQYLLDHYKRIHVFYLATISKKNTIILDYKEVKDKCTNLFYNRKKKRGDSGKSGYTHKYYEPETILQKSNPQIDWELKLVKKRIEEIIDISADNIETAKSWNEFVLKKKIRVWRGNIVESVNEYVDKNNNSFQILSFLGCLYKNGVLNLDDIVKIVQKNLVKKFEKD